MMEFLINLSNYFLMRSRIKKFGQIINTHQCNLALQFDSLQYLSQDISEDEINMLYNSLILSKIWVLEESNLNILKDFLAMLRSNKIIDNQLSEAEYWYIDLNLLSQLDFNVLKEFTSELLNIFSEKKVVLIVDSIHLYFNITNSFDEPDSFNQLINYTDRFVSTLMAKDNVYIIGIRNR